MKATPEEPDQRVADLNMAIENGTCKKQKDLKGAENAKPENRGEITHIWLEPWP